MIIDQEVQDCTTAYERGRATGQAVTVGQLFGGAIPAAEAAGYERDTPPWRVFVHAYLDGLNARSVTVNKHGLVTEIGR
jgi:hypothetical protein